MIKHKWTHVRTLIIIALWLLLMTLPLYAQDETSDGNIQSPDPAFLIDQLNIRVVRCGGIFGPLDCWLAQILFPDGSLRRDWSVPIENRAAVEAPILGVASPLTNASAGVTTRAEVQLVGADDAQLPSSLPANSVTYLSMKINPDRLELGTYRGNLRISVEGLEAPMMLPIELTVRAGPLLALLVIIAGIAMGRMARGMETPEAKTQLGFVPRINKLEDLNSDLRDAVAQIAFQAQLLKLKERNNHKEAAESLDPDIKALSTRIEGMTELQKVVDGLSDKKWQGTALKDLVNPLISAARKEWLKFDDDKSIGEAQKIHQKILAEIEITSAESVRSGGAEPEIEAIKTILQNKEPETPPSPPPSSLGKELRRFFERLSGLPQNAEVRYYLVRPVLWLAAMIFFILLGLQNQYINAATSFGANGFYDYLGLFLWGVSSDVASASLLRMRDTLGANNG